MESRTRRILLTLRDSATAMALTVMLAAPCSLAVAQEQIDAGQEQIFEPNIERPKIKEPKLDVDDFEFGVYAGLLSVEDFGSNAVYGLRLGYHVLERLFVEGYYGVSSTDETSFEVLSGAARLLTDSERDYKYYNVSLGFSILPGEAFLTSQRAFNTSLYLIAGMGNTRFGGDDRFTLSAGAGYRLLLSDWLALRLDFRDHIFDSDLIGKKKTTHNMEWSGGFTIFF